MLGRAALVAAAIVAGAIAALALIIAVRWNPRVARCAGHWQCTVGQSTADATLFPDGRIYAIFDGGEGGSQVGTLRTPLGDRRWTCSRRALHFFGSRCQRPGPYRLLEWLEFLVWYRDDFDDR
jgi:hypothetical protein